MPDDDVAGLPTELRNALGAIYTRLDRPPDARRAFERSLELHPTRNPSASR